MATLQELRPIHGKPIKQNKSVGLILSTAVTGSVLFAVYVGLNRNLIVALVEDIQAVVVTEEVKNEAPPPPLPPDFKPPTVTAIAPEVTINLAAVRTPPAAITVTAPPPPAPPKPVIAAPPPPPPPPPPTPATATTSHQVTADDYPPVSIRLQEQGKVAIKYTIAADGSVTDCAVTTTSGKPRLDDAACTMVKKRWKFKPATQDGKPVSVSLPAEVIFALK
jgi:protein TonB